MTMAEKFTYLGYNINTVIRAASIANVDMWKVSNLIDKMIVNFDPITDSRISVFDLCLVARGC